nr:hypothetical protein CFP56_30730 [Quercus suber]
MQRASTSQPSSPSTPDGPAAKKQRLSQGSHKSTPHSTPRTESQAEMRDSGERKRATAVEREGAERGETKWYLSFQEPQAVTQDSSFRINQAGFSAIDAPGSSRNTETEEVPDNRSGRRSFGKFNKTLEKQQNPDLPDSDLGSESSDDTEEDQSEPEEDEDEGDPNGANAMIREARKEAADRVRAERKAKKMVAKSEAVRLAEERRKKQVKLNGSDRLPSISANAARNVECYRCGEKGHFKSQCPSDARNTKQQRM